MVYAAAGSHGQPVPMQPAATANGTRDALLFDWELVFERTVSVATSPWSTVPAPQLDYRDAIVCGHAPAGTSLLVEFRGRATAASAPTAWSASPNVADGMPWLQFRVTMTPDAATGVVPWVDTLIVPVQ